MIIGNDTTIEELFKKYQHPSFWYIKPAVENNCQKLDFNDSIIGKLIRYLQGNHQEQRFVRFYIRANQNCPDILFQKLMLSTINEEDPSAILKQWFPFLKEFFHHQKILDFLIAYYEKEEVYEKCRVCQVIMLLPTSAQNIKENSFFISYFLNEFIQQSNLVLKLCLRNQALSILNNGTGFLRKNNIIDEEIATTIKQYKEELDHFQSLFKNEKIEDLIKGNKTLESLARALGWC